MIARFSSRCPSCRGSILVGSTISKMGRRFVCEDCAGTPSSHPDGPTAFERGDRSPGAIASHYDRTGFYTADGALIGRQNSHGRCEDAPCCGCCS